MDSIQVLRTIDKVINNEGNVKIIKQIQINKGFSNIKEDDTRTTSLEQILLRKDIKDLPVFVFAIGGKIREGKSFLLDLMILFLESLENSNNGDWRSKTVPNYFLWKRGPESITKGIWICPKIFKIKNGSGEKVGVLLMDMEGMYGDDATDGEIIAMSGLSALISHVQFFNMKDNLTTDRLESLVTKLITGIVNESTAKKIFKENFKLILIVRDWDGEELHPFGLDGGKSCLERKMAKPSKKPVWEIIKQTFNDIECVLLPHPGFQIKSPAFEQSASLELLEETFLSHVQSFFEHIFHPDSLIVKSSGQPTGKSIYDTLMRVDGKDIDENCSLINMFTDNRNLDMMEMWIKRFQDMLDKITYSEVEEAKKEKSKIISEATKLFIGRSRGKHLEDLTRALEGKLNRKIVDLYTTKYNNSFLATVSVEEQHKKLWQNVRCVTLENLCGNNQEASWKRAYLDFLKKCAEYYYHKVYQSRKQQFQEKISKITTLKECAGIDKETIKSFKECEDFSHVNYHEDIHPLWLKQYQCLKHEITELMLQAVEKITGIEVSILKNLRRKQYEHFECFTLLNKDELNLDCVSPIDVEVIAKKVGYASFGLPGVMLFNNDNTTNAEEREMSSPDNQERMITIENTGFSKEQELKIKQVVEKMINLSTENKVEFSCVFVVYNDNNNNNSTINVPVFRFKKGDNIIYIDSNSREYVDWNDFLMSNTLPDVVYCYPLRGRYVKEEEFFVGFSATPASETATKLLNTSDKIGVGLTVGAGIGACILTCGVATPLLVGATFASTICGGSYGMIRGIQKVRDKINHNEPIETKDYWNVASNGCAFVGGAGMVLTSTVTAAEGIFMISRSVAGFIGVTTFTSFCTSSDETKELISFIAKVEDSYLKVLFYFGSRTLADTLHTIRKYLKLETNSTKFKVLSALLENNSIEHAVESGSRGVIVEKYISENVANLVTCILNEVSLDVKGVLLDYGKFRTLIDLFKVKLIGKNEVAESTQKILKKLSVKVDEECNTTHKILGDQMCQNIGILSKEFLDIFTAKLTEKEGLHLILGFRLIIWTLIGEVRKANKFINNINHETVQLINNHLDGLVCHPLCEIMEQVKEVLKQTESAVIDFNTREVDELNSFIVEILKLLRYSVREDWTVGQIYRCLENISKDIKTGFTRIVSQHECIVRSKGNVTCYDLPIIINEIGMRSYDYGIWVSKQVLSKLAVDVESLTRDQVEECVSVMCAWDDLMPNLHYYFSSSLNCNKELLIKKIENASIGNYNIIALPDYGVTIYEPAPQDISGEWSSFLIYSEVEQGIEKGFIFVYKSGNAESNSEIINDI